MPDTRFEQLVAASSRIDAERRQPLPARTPAETAAAFKALALGALRGLRDARAGNGYVGHMLRASARRHQVSALALAALYRRRAADALADATDTKATVRNMLTASVDALQTGKAA